MENEMEIFRAWLKKAVKDDKIIKGNVLAKRLDIPATRISYYHSGRVDNGTRTYPAIPFEIREKILKITNTPYDEMMQIGRETLQPKATVTQLTGEEIIKLIQGEVIKQTRQPGTSTGEDSKPGNSILNIENDHPALKKHYRLLRQFPNPEKALELNSLAVDLTKIEPGEIDKVINFIKERLEFQRTIKGITQPQQQQQQQQDPQEGAARTGALGEAEQTGAGDG